jgi:hypothetical protein
MFSYESVTARIETSSITELYARRSLTVFQEIPNRISMFMGYDAISRPIVEFGLSGGGLGVGTGVTEALVGRHAFYHGSEGALGKIISELGPFGAAFGILFFFSFSQHFFLQALSLIERDKLSAYFTAGTIAFLLNNFALFVVATNVFADPGIMTLIGLAIGMTLGLATQHRQLEPAVDFRAGLHLSLPNGPRPTA